MRHGKYRLIIPFIVPGLALYCLFVIYPDVQGLYVSLTRWRGLTASKEFVGLANFVSLLGDDYFWKALANTLLLLATVPFLTLGLSLSLAALMETRGRSRGFYRLIYFLPQAISAVAVAVLWGFVYHPTIGLLNASLEAARLAPLRHTWLGDPGTALWAVIVVIAWQGFGFYVSYLMAAIDGIPASLYEAATLEGSSKLQNYRYITVPLIWQAIQTSFIYLQIGALGTFALIMVMTGGGPNRASDVLGTYMYQEGFRNARFGYATAIGVVILALTLAVSLATWRLTRRDAVEY